MLGRDVTETTDSDALIDDMILGMSKRFEQFLGRGISLANRQDYIDVMPGQKTFYLWSWPVSTFEDVRHDHEWNFGATTALDTDLFTMLGRDGILQIERFPLVPGKRVLRVDYTGGMGTDTANFILNYPDLAEAADMQIAFEFRARVDIGTLSISDAGGSVTNRDLNLLPAVKDRLTRHRRKPSK